ncbi:DUF4399 domain-containing protein [Roseibium sp. Sym1]|uniref:DUF4399 domain-containing protein n=1 Tax=Roseibium sp. Sym1 TaxID=3016006 RepID=UPI0022B35ED1|nr:DUF4399 domain-containing protein [Roseibium sp. Sym1]
MVGAAVKAPVTIKSGLSGMVVPAGTEKENTGHHHLIIDEAIEDRELNGPIPAKWGQRRCRNEARALSRLLIRRGARVTRAPAAVLRRCRGFPGDAGR